MVITTTRVRSALPGVGVFDSGVGVVPIVATHVPAAGAWRGVDGTAGTAAFAGAALVAVGSALAVAHPVANDAVAPRPVALPVNVPVNMPVDVPTAFQAGDKRVTTIAKQGARRTKGSSPWRFPV